VPNGRTAGCVTSQAGGLKAKGYTRENISVLGIAEIKLRTLLILEWCLQLVI